MNILFTLHNFYPEQIFGAERICIQQMRELIRRGYNVGLFYPGNKPAPWGQLVDRGLEKLHLFRTPYWETKAQVLLSASNPRMDRRFCRVLDRFAPDIVVFHHLVRLSMTLPARAAARDIPTIGYLHDFYFICSSYSLLMPDGGTCKGPGLTKCARCLFEIRYGSDARVRRHGWIIAAAIPFLWLRNRIRKGLQEHLDLFVSPSRFLIAEMRRQGFRIDSAIVIPNGADIAKTPYARHTKDPIRFGYLGNPLKKKGIEVLVQAFRGSMGRRLVIRGFSDNAAIKTFRKENPAFQARLEVFSEEKASFFKEIDCLIVPSICYENQPAVIIEAFTHGKPVICSDLGGMSEMVEDKRCGFLFRAGDSEDLGRKVMWLMEHPLEVDRMAKAVPKWPSVKDNADLLVTAIEQAIRKKGVGMNQGGWR